MMDLEKIQINLDQIYISINFTKILTDWYEGHSPTLMEL